MKELAESAAAGSSAAATHGRQKLVGFTLALVAVAYLDRICISTAAPARRARNRSVGGLRAQSIARRALRDVRLSDLRLVLLHHVATTYLLKARGFDLRQTGFLAALPLVAIAGGVFAGGSLSDRLAAKWGGLNGRRAPGLVGFPLAALATAIGINTPDPLTSALLLAVAAGMAALGVAPAWVVSTEIGGVHAGAVR
jgi:hypothetical protein